MMVINTTTINGTLISNITKIEKVYQATASNKYQIIISYIDNTNSIHGYSTEKLRNIDLASIISSHVKYNQNGVYNEDSNSNLMLINNESNYIIFNLDKVINTVKSTKPKSLTPSYLIEINMEGYDILLMYRNSTTQNTTYRNLTSAITSVDSGGTPDASKWEDVTESQTARKSGLILEFGEPQDGDLIVIGSITAEFDSDGVWDPSNYRIDMTDFNTAVPAWIEYNNANNTSANLFIDDEQASVEAKVSGESGNSIPFSSDMTVVAKNPYTLEVVPNASHFVGGRDEGIVTTNKIQPKDNKTIDGSIIENLPSLNGTQYLYVTGDGTPTENGTELQAAYDLAKTMSPSATNRITIIVGPGKYEFTEAKVFTLNTEYIDVISLTGNSDVFVYKTSSAEETVSERSNIRIDTDNVYIKGIDASTVIFIDSGKGGIIEVEGSFSLGDDFPNLIVENCIGGSQSFGYNINASGTFKNCTAFSDSFGYYASASGTFENCTSADNSFGHQNVASGTFINCHATINSFGYSGTASGTFKNCTAVDGYSFGFIGAATGTFENCVAGDYSFGHLAIASGTFKNCLAGRNSFGYSSQASGIFENCVAGENSFGGGSASFANGIFTNCRAEGGSFGGQLTGQLYYCRMTAGGGFPNPITTGKIVASIDAFNQFYPEINPA